MNSRTRAERATELPSPAGDVPHQQDGRAALQSEATRQLSSPHNTPRNRIEPIELREVGDYVVRRLDTLNSIARRSLAHFGQDRPDRSAVRSEEARIVALNERWYPELRQNHKSLAPGMLLVIQQGQAHSPLNHAAGSRASADLLPAFGQERNNPSLTPLDVRTNGSYVVKPEDDMLSIARRSLLLRGQATDDKQKIMEEAARILFLNFHYYPQVWTDARTLQAGMILETFEPEHDQGAAPKIWNEVPPGTAGVARDGDHVVVGPGSRGILRPGSKAIVGPSAQAFVFKGAQAEAFPGSLVISAGGEVLTHPGAQVVNHQGDESLPSPETEK